MVSERIRGVSGRSSREEVVVKVGTRFGCEVFVRHVDEDMDGLGFMVRVIE